MPRPPQALGGRFLKKESHALQDANRLDFLDHQTFFSYSQLRRAGLSLTRQIMLVSGIVKMFCAPLEAAPKKHAERYQGG